MKFPRFRRNELIVWGDCEPTRAMISDFTKTNIDLKKLKRRKVATCDPSLELWEDPTIKIFNEGEVVRSGTGSKTTAAGSGCCLNFRHKSPMMKEQVKYDIPPVTLTPNDGPLVAIFDTGIDTGLIKYPALASTCLREVDGTKGWNFVDDNNDVTDNHPSKHGTLVTKFILDAVGTNSINILPVKVLDHKGEGTLFQLLQGFAYAWQSGAKIINASLGFYHYGTGAPEILKEYIEEYLTANGVLLIAAAGNKDTTSNKSARVNNIPNNLWRNIEKHCFYPAALSKDLSNIISVTTVNQNIEAVSLDQNYSPISVNIGVVADKGDLFENPVGEGQVWGSSFATPLFTGKLYSALRGQLVADKNQIFDAMLSQLLISEEKPLFEQIQYGRCMKTK